LVPNDSLEKAYNERTAPTSSGCRVLESSMRSRNLLLLLTLTAGLAFSPFATAQTQSAPTPPAVGAPAAAPQASTPAADAPQEPLSLDELVAILTDKKTSHNASSIVVARGTKFDLSKDNVEKIRKAGGD